MCKVGDKIKIEAGDNADQTVELVEVDSGNYWWARFGDSTEIVRVGKPNLDFIVISKNDKLRDDIAMRAMSGLLQNAIDWKTSHADLAETSYMIADAMLRARKGESQ